ncbi:helix-turn-helix transcriptional regulator [Saccharothrix deserti]|uniref:helix-turn-helix transcriptional regulator n=1 Tax=Saccharothrix deserti TaxID=2593674 RepID=UPI001EE4D097|nr:WYL domain-containing protein [Saccharothrix deserti]
MSVMTMPGRMLRLLSLMQGRRDWTGPELAERLGVTDRTVRRDIERLRELGYPVDGTTGTAGGYRLASGRNLPPLLLDDDEAVAVAVDLRTAAGVNGIEESSTRALAKLEQVLPARLRQRIGAVRDAIAVMTVDGPVSDPAALGVLAAACRDHEVVAFTHRGEERRVEPRSLVTAYRRWYLLAYDPAREDWRTFRVDRMDAPRATGRRFTPRELPSDPAEYVARSLTTAPYRFTCTATVDAPAAVVRSRLVVALPGRVEAVDERTCRVRLGANAIEHVAADLLLLGADYTLDASPELLAALREVGSRLTGRRPAPPGAPGSR